MTVKPEWLIIAESELGTAEVPGAGNNPRIAEYAACTSLKASEDSVPWCSSFTNWCFKQAGIKGTGLANARSWLKWGTGIDKPTLGCVVVLKRGAPPSGHVTFYTASLGEDKIVCLGGNQGDKVKYSTYLKSEVLSYRWPTTV
jgi:uncharacterized protein (TIGR02594 family)